MAQYTSYESAFHQLLDKHIQQLIVDKSIDLGNGDARKPSDVNATAMEYSGQVLYIKALRDVLQISKDIAREMMKAG